MRISDLSSYVCSSYLIDPDQPVERNEYVVSTAAPICVLTTERDGFDAEGVLVVRIDTVDLSGCSDAPVTDADRLGPLRGAHTDYSTEERRVGKACVSKGHSSGLPYN